MTTEPDLKNETDNEIGFEGELKSKVTRSIQADLYKSITPESERAIENTLSSVSNIFNDPMFNRQWYIAGGLALELAANKVRREHQDIDVAIFKEDAETLYEVLKGRGYVVERPVRETEIEEYAKQYRHEAYQNYHSSNGTFYVPVQTSTEFAEGGHNAFCRVEDNSREDVNPPFEVMLLETNDGQIVLDEERGISIGRDVYETTEPFTIRNGENVKFTPPEVQLFYKLTDGREKDRYDIEASLGTLNEEQQARLTNLLSSGNITFSIDGQTVSGVEELLVIANEKSQREVQGKIPEKVGQTIDKVLSGYKGTMKTLYNFLSEPDISQSSFLDKISSTFPKEYVDRNTHHLVALSTFAFSGQWDRSPRSLNKFMAEQTQIQQRVERDIEPYVRLEIQGTQLWDVTKSNLLTMG